MTNPLKDKADRVASFANEKSEAARAAANDAYEAARDKLNTAYDSARETATSVTRRAGDGLSEAPLAVVAGGLALGAILGALLPGTKRETELLGPVGGKLSGVAKGAAEAAKAAGFAKLDELGINRDNARAQVDKLVEAVSQGATSAGSAAASTIRKP
jgi:ElaB/YqjD/DUF883 family membrane-anchored ribosome-binding protein